MSLLGALACVVALSSGPEVEVLHFEAPGCVHCRAMEPTVERLRKTGVAIRHIDASEDPDTAGKYRVRGVPCFVVLVDGEERDRHDGTASFDRLNSMVVQAQRAATDSEDRASTNFRNDETPKWRSEAKPTAESEATEENFAAPSAPVSAAATPAQIRQASLNSTVRIRIEDRPGQVSYGTGTIIDTRNGHALVITCGHLFRDSGKKGRVTIDAFVDGAKRTIEARVLDFDLEYEIGLLVMSPGGVVQSVQVADESGQPKPGQPLFSVGCNAGADPTIMEMQVTAIDRFMGAPNIECTGSPVQGRSGGGLFNEAGQLVAVCFGALGGEERGAYSGLPTIHWLLTKHNLAEIFEATPAAATQVGNLVAEVQQDEPVVEDRIPVPEIKPQREASRPQRPDRKLAGKLVEAEETLPDSNLEFTSPDDRRKPFARPNRLIADAVAEASSESPTQNEPLEPVGGARSRIGKLLDEQLLKMDPGAEDADVICIIKPKGAPTAKRKVLVLENPSPEFLTRLAHEKQAQELFSNLPARKPAPAQVAKSIRSSGAKLAKLQGAPQ
jgi:thiol-disulfide isomerase/thioredoxin